ncbi:MAG: hypothetical protein PHN74_03245, partial [Candidatus Pacebacteria bacterium]|nr:hypothetical protein [Candidatus Paceibacterota bacterium]
GNTWGLITELDKLSLLGEKKITKEIVKKYFDDLPTLDVFDALNGIREARGVGARLAILEELFSRSQDPGMIFNMMAASPYSTVKQKIEFADYDVAVKSGKMDYEEVLLSVCLGK